MSPRFASPRAGCIRPFALAILTLLAAGCIEEEIDTEHSLVLVPSAPAAADGKHLVQVEVMVVGKHLGPAEKVQVEILASGSGNTLLDEGICVTDRGGSCRVYVASTVPGVKTITAFANGHRLAARPTVKFVEPPKPRLAFRKQPSDVKAGAAMPAIEVAFLDGYDQVAAEVQAVVTLSLNGEGLGPSGTQLQVGTVGGVATFAGLSFCELGSGLRLTASSGTSTALSDPFDVSPGDATAFRLEPTGAPSTGKPVFQVEEPANVALHIEDACGNPATGYRGTVTFSSTDPQAILPTPYPFTGPHSGQRLFEVTFETLGTGFLLEASDAAAGLSAELALDVKAGPPASVVLAGIPATLPAGATSHVSIGLLDKHGHPATFANGAQATFTSDDPNATLPAPTTFTGSQYTWLDAVSFCKTGYRTVTVKVGSTLGATVGTIVSQGSLGGFLLTPSALTLAAGSSFALTITAKDACGNKADNFTGPVAITSSDPQATLPVLPTFTSADAGEKVLMGIVLRTAGSQALTATATGGGITGTRQLTVIPGSAASFVITGFTSPLSAGAPTDFTVRAVDTFGNRAIDYFGTAHFTTTDGRATLTPSSHAFTPADAGEHLFPQGAVFRSPGSWTLTVTDQSNPLVKSQASVTVELGPAARLAFVGPPLDTVVGEVLSPAIAVEVRDAGDNLLTAATDPVTLSLLETALVPIGATLSGTLTRAASGGVASFDDLIVDRASAGLMLGASAPGLAPATSAPFDAQCAPGFTPDGSGACVGL